MSEHCLWVSNLRCLRTFWKVTSKLPAHHEPTEDLLRISLQIGTQIGLGSELPFEIAYRDRAHGHGGQTRRVPHGRRRSDLDLTLPAPIPVGDLGRLPNGGRVLGHHRKVGLPLALEARPAPLPGTTWRSRFVEGGVYPDTGDEGHRLARRSAR